METSFLLSFFLQPQKQKKWAQLPLLISFFPSSFLLLVSFSNSAAKLSSGSVWFSHFLAIFLELSMLSILSLSDNLAFVNHE
ncbi:hypothetical protein P8452_63050 [Trifolium repens]|nr:hypothetical protein P8452_63050 [Trifolium repens]